MGTYANEGIFKNVDQPADYTTRLNYAKKTCTEQNVHRKILIDNMDGKVQRLYGGLPNMLYIIDPTCKIIYHNRWADAIEVKKILRSIVSNKVGFNVK